MAIDLKVLIKNGVQFGHQAWRWCPKMDRFIWGKKNGVHLIDVSQTASQLSRAAKFLEDIAANGKQILWVGTKSAAQNVVQQGAEKLKAPYVRNRWIGGTLTNFSQVKKSVTKLLHYEDILSKTDKYSYTKKEFGVFQKLVDRLNANVGGIRDLSWPVSALVVIDARKEAVAIKEAISAGIPVVALVDTNADPSGIDYVIPGNDDVERAISVIMNELVAAVERGQAKAEAGKKEREELAAQKAAATKDAQPAKKPAPKKAAPKKPAVKAEDKKEAAPKAAAPAKKAAAKEVVKAAEKTAEKPAPKKAAPKKPAVKAADKKEAAPKTAAPAKKAATATKKKTATTKKADKAS